MGRFDKRGPKIEKYSISNQEGNIQGGEEGARSSCQSRSLDKRRSGGEVRNSFRKFMGENPDKFDYKIAQIPAPLDKKEEEERERKEREKKREKEKAQKEEEAKVKAEEAEKQRFLNLTD